MYSDWVMVTKFYVKTLMTRKTHCLGSSRIGFQKWEADKREGEDGRPGGDAEHGLPVSQVVEYKAPCDPSHSVHHTLHGCRDGEEGVIAYVDLGFQLNEYIFHCSPMWLVFIGHNTVQSNPLKGSTVLSSKNWRTEPFYTL